MDSMSGVLLRTILEVTNCPQPAGTALRLQYQDVTVRKITETLHWLNPKTDTGKIKKIYVTKQSASECPNRERLQPPVYMFSFS